MGSEVAVEAEVVASAFGVPNGQRGRGDVMSRRAMSIKPAEGQGGNVRLNNVNTGSELKSMKGMKQTRVGFEVEVVTSTFVTPAWLRNRRRVGRARLRYATWAPRDSSPAGIEIAAGARGASAFAATTRGEACRAADVANYRAINRPCRSPSMSILLDAFSQATLPRSAKARWNARQTHPAASCARFSRRTVSRREMARFRAHVAI
jgi:hypothetical protein